MTSVLTNGKVLIMGGLSFNDSQNYSSINTAELYDPVTGVFTSTGSMSQARNSHTATMLANGKVLVTAGFNSWAVNGQWYGECLGTAELYGSACITPPVISALTASPAVLWPPNNKMVPVKVGAIVSDTCDPSPVTKIISVSSNEPVNSDAVASGDAIITGNLSLNLRTQRNGNGNGRFYTITIQSVDNSGNTTKGTVTVVVPHDQGK